LPNSVKDFTVGEETNEEIIYMNYENRSANDELLQRVQLKKRMDIEDHRSDLDDDRITPEIAMNAMLAREFGHIAIRHAKGEISQDDHDRFRELYIDKALKHTTIIDRSAVARDFDIRVDAMLPVAHADIYDAMIEQGVDVLEEFTPPKAAAQEMASSGDKALLQENLSLKEDNARLLNQSVVVLRQMRELRKQMATLRQERDDLALGIAPVYHDASSNV
jgi:hypothetical protein